MSQAWLIAEALLGGTASMRAAGESFLPRWPNEEPGSYDARLKTATLFPAFARTISVMSGKPFSKQLTMQDDVPPRLREWCDNVDLQGNNLHSFAADLMAEALGFGICGVLVDYPKVGEAVRTLADERNIKARPYAVLIRHSQILGWRAEMSDGVVRLTQLRLAESAEVPDGEFGTATVRRVRVLVPGGYALYQEGEKDEFALIEEGTTTLKAIPFVPFYGKKRGFMSGVSPLLDLAYLNVQHWQDSSDQQKSVRFARVRIAAIIGAEDLTTPISLGADYFMRLPHGADIKVVQGSAEAVKIGREELAVLEDQMITTGAELLVIKPGEQKSATQSNNEAEANKSDLQRIVEQFEDGLDQVLQLMADWVGEPQGGHVSLFKDFGAATLTDASAQLILAMQQGGLITKETAIREQQRRGMLAADIVPVQELEAVSQEGPALGALTGEDENSQRAAA